MCFSNQGLELSWLERRADNAEVSGSIPDGPTMKHSQKFDKIFARVHGTATEIFASGTGQ